MFCVTNSKVILAAEARAEDAERLLRSLAPLDETVYLAASAEEALALMRRTIFDQAVVAAELTLKGISILARLSLLPTVTRLVATGPPGDPDVEARARRAGASVYLTRPVTTDALARALHMPSVPDGVRARPP